MRIALLTHKIGHQDGQGRVNYEIVQAALAQGHHVTIFAEFCSDEIAAHPHAQFIQARRRRIPTQMARNLYYAWKSARWLKRHRAEFDIVQANGFVTWEPADVVAVHFVHSAWLTNPWYPFRWSSFRPYAYYQRLLTLMNAHFERKVFREAKTIVAVSRFTAGEVAALGIPQNKISVVLNGVDVEEFRPGLSERAAFRLPENVTLALFVGDIRTARKNLDTVLKAMQSVEELHLAVAGDVQQSPYPAMAAELGIAQRVHFLGRTSRISALMRSVDFFVFPSRYEAHPLVLMEAMASGLPILVSGSFGAADYIGEAGKVFEDPNDASHLADLMLALVNSAEYRKETGRKAREQALGMQWAKTAQGYLDIYQRLMDRHEGSTQRIDA